MLDVGAGQCSCSGTMKLKIDRWATSYAALERQKLEIALAPNCKDSTSCWPRPKTILAASSITHRTTASGPANNMVGSAPPKDSCDPPRTVRASSAAKTDGTPYAFIGLQLSEIVQSHVVPARESFWSALQSDADAARRPKIRSGWEQVVRRPAAASIDRAVRTHSPRTPTRRITPAGKNDVPLLLEDSFAMLNSRKPIINRYERHFVELDLDEAVLKRIQEILKQETRLDGRTVAN